MFILIKYMLGNVYINKIHATQCLKDPFRELLIERYN